MNELYNLLNRAATTAAAGEELAKSGKTLEDLHAAAKVSQEVHPDKIIEFMDGLIGPTINEDGTRNAFNYSLVVVGLASALAKVLVKDSLVVHPNALLNACERTAGSVEVLAEQLHTLAQGHMADHMKGQNPVDLIKQALGIKPGGTEQIFDPST